VFTLLVEMRCNSYCIFCGLRQVDDSVVRRRARAGLTTPSTPFGAARGTYDLEAAVGALRAARSEGFDELSLQGGEPSIWPHVVALVREARAMGFSFIGMVTNGRKLADPVFAAELVGAGLDGITGSLVGWNAETHDGLALAPGAFDELLRGLQNAAQAAAAIGAAVTINANVIASAETIDHLDEQVHLLAGAGVRAAAVHLVRFDGLGDDPSIRRRLRFDVRRVTAALERAGREARRLGVSLHASDVPMCLHPSLDPEDLRLIARRAAVREHRYRGASVGFDGQNGRPSPRPDACAGCLLDEVCTRVPPGHLPEPAGEAFAPITPAYLAAHVDAHLGELDVQQDDAAIRVADLARAVDLLAKIAPFASALSDVARRLDEALLDLTKLGYARRRRALMTAAFWSYLRLRPPRATSAVDFDLLGRSAAELARATGAIPTERAGLWPRLRLGGGFELAIEGGERSDGGTFVGIRSLRPILRPASEAADRLYRALFACMVCAPLSGARSLRLLDDRLLVDRGGGFEEVWSFERAGAVKVADAGA
jgi:MoaA/NifB/PqqE/SkfB family radical SAM enzyme